MTPVPKRITILMADDDHDDCQMAREAITESRIANPFVCVSDGQELLDYLHRREPYGEAVLPGLVLLDLNMPRVEGRQALREIKADPQLRHIPVVILTTSSQEEDIYRTYQLGASSFITKPVTFEGLVAVMVGLRDYWFEIVRLPDAMEHRAEA
jgi:CheY-like chemotaxis protein